MPVTTRVSPVEVHSGPVLPTFNSTSLLQRSCPSIWKTGNSVLGSSFGDSIHDTIAVQPSHFGDFSQSSNGFVGTVLDAYLEHHHLVLRPEDIWFTIIVQFSFYVNSHAEDLRSYFVDHDGKRKLKIVQYEMDLPAFAIEMTDMIAQNVKDPKLRNWIMPDFSTTTATDKVTAAIIMMGTMQKYFAYSLEIGCGIPSVTLLGEKKDWEDILQRLDYLKSLPKGDGELDVWHSVLSSVLVNFVDTFDSPDFSTVAKFWQKAVHEHRDDYSGDRHITGWILAFCFWDTEGRPLIARTLPSYAQGWEKGVRCNGPDWWFEGKRLGMLQWQNVPSAYAQVPIHVRIRNPPEKFVAKGIAGTIGWSVLDSDAIFAQTRNAARAGSSASSQTVVEKVSLTKPSILSRIAQKILCFGSSDDTSSPESVDNSPTEKDELLRSREQKQEEGSVPQFSDLDELNEPWAHENGGKHDALQPVSGWWVMKTVDGQYGKDPDVPDVQYDTDAEDYDEDLAYYGRALQGEL